MIHNLILFLYYKYRNEVLQYFTNEALEVAKEDSQDENMKRVVCSIDRFMEEEEEDLIRLEAVQIYIKVNKQVVEAQKEITS